MSAEGWAICITLVLITIILTSEIRMLGGRLEKAIEILHHIKIGKRD